MAKALKTAQQGVRLTEDEVRSRLGSIQSVEVLDEVSELGQALLKDATDRTKGVESKAATFAAYGTGLVAFLIAITKDWVPVHGVCIQLTTLFSGLAAGLCTYHCVEALILRPFEVISQDDWLNAECLNADLLTMKKLWTVSTWGALDAQTAAQEEKAGHLMLAETWLRASVAYLLLMFLWLFWGRTGVYTQWITLRYRTIHGHKWVAFGNIIGHLGPARTLAHWSCTTLLILSFAFTFWRTRRA